MSSALSKEEVVSTLAPGFDVDSKTAESTEEKPQPIVPPVFPEGGSKAWLVVLGCWCTSFASFGIVNSFG